MNRDESAQYVPVRVAAGPVDPAAHSGDDAAGATAGAANPLLVAHALLRGRYLVTVALAIVLAAIGVAAGWVASRPEYQSTGVIQISPSIPNVARDKETLIPMFDAYLDSQVAFIRSDRLLGKAMESEQWMALGRGMSPAAVAQFTAALTVTHPPRSQLIQVAFNDRDPRAAKLAAQMVIESYKELYAEHLDDDYKVRLTALETRISTKSSDIRKIDERIGDIAKEAGSTYIEKIADGRIREKQDLWDKLNAVRLQLETADALRHGFAAATSPSATQPTLVSRPALNVEVLAGRNPLMRSYVEQRAELELSMVALKSRLGDRHNRVTEAEDRLQELNRRIAELAEKMSEAEATWALPAPLDPSQHRASSADIEQLRVTEQVLKRQFDAADEAVKSLARQEQEVKRLSNDKALAQADLDEARRRREDLNLSQSITGRITQVGMPELPITPLKDKRAAFAGVGACGGIALGVGSVLLFGLLNRRIRHIDDAHLDLCQGIPLLGILPELPKDLSDPDQTSVAVHSVHRIRAMLQLASGAGGSAGRAYAVTSPAAGDGKTSLTLALGLSFAACGDRTLLIDFDLVGHGLTHRASRMIRPKLGRILRRQNLITSEQLRTALHLAADAHRRLGQALVSMKLLTETQLKAALAVQRESLTGLLDVLAGEPLDECVSGAGVKGLFVLPVGSARAKHIGRLSPAAIRAVLDEARKEFDVVIVDTGPVLGSLEASMVAPAADGVVVAVSRGEQRPLARRSMDHLISIGARVLGVVFNRAHGYDVLSSRFSSSTSTRLLSRPQQDVVDSVDDLDARLGPVGSAVANAAGDGR